MIIAVVGCGAMGSIYAALLADAGNDVLVVDTNAAHVAAINADGLRVSGASGDRRVALEASTEAPAHPVDLVVIAAKAAQAAAAADTARPLIGADTLVLTIQNGLGGADAVAGAVGHDRLIVGVAQGFGASLPEPGHAHHNDMKAIRMGPYSELSPERVAQVAAVWREAGFDAAAVSDIHAMQWEKLICNVAYSAPCALTGLTVGEVMDDPVVGPVSRAAATEAWTVARACGIGIDVADPVRLVREFAGRMPAAKPSVLLDVEARRISEVDVINGAVPREARKVGMEAPVNMTLTALVKALERRSAGVQGAADLLRDADRRRRQAMVDGDAAVLSLLLADDLIWTHSSGRTDDKASFLAKIRGGATVYESLEVSDDLLTEHGEVVVHHGTLSGRVVADGHERALANRFLSVWKRSGDDFQLLAWQSTGLTTPDPRS